MKSIDHGRMSLPQNRFISMQTKMHEVFREAFQGIGLESIRLIGRNQNCPSFPGNLIRKPPHIELMTLKHKGNQSIFSQGLNF